MDTIKRVVEIVRHVNQHWVGDGFPVRTLFSYTKKNVQVSPFLLLDYAAPTIFPPALQSKGVQSHPHRGFETVTIVYQGELEHQDTAGNKGKIGPGDVQWMTAGRGIMHQEYHGQEFTKKGGTFEVVQLWVNLPAKDKMSPPGYQEIVAAEIPEVALNDNAGTLRVIAGNFNGTKGAAKTFTPIHLWDISVRANHKVQLTLEENFTAALLIRTGRVLINATETATNSELVHFDIKGTDILLEALENTQCLLMSGEPIDDPIVGYGPFVMNTEQEIQQAIKDFQENSFY